MNKILTLIKAYIKGTFSKIHKGIINKCRKHIYKYEFNEVFNYTIEDTYYEYERNPNMKVGVLSPAVIVTKMMEKYFGFEKYVKLRIHGIVVDTQNNEQYTVTISLNRPGLLIGKAGKDFYAMEDLLGNYFGVKTKITIKEVKDVNIPIW